MDNTLTTYEKIGGAATVAKLCDRFYELMDSVPQFQGLRAMHPESLEGSREKLYMFLSGWSGGPALYTEKYGPPKLRQRHMPFSIGIAERDQWVACMDQAMQETHVDATLRTRLKDSFMQTADWMRNRGV